MSGIRGMGWAALLALSSVAAGELREIRVGVFPVEPLSYVDETGTASGFHTDLLRAVAKERNAWTPVFVEVTWGDGLRMLQTGELDLMPSVTLTKQRLRTMDFTKEALCEVWGQVYVRPDSGLESVLDLEGREIALMTADINGENFIKLADSFGVEYSVVEFKTHGEVLAAVARGAADAAVVPNHFGLRHAKRNHLVGTAIQFAPSPVFFAAKKGRNGEVLADIDAVLSGWKNDENSTYYQRFDYWFGAVGAEAEGAPTWLWALLGVALIATVSLSGLSWLFNRRVKARTAQLSESEERYRMLVENHSDLVVKVDAEGRFLYVSPSYCEMFGKSERSLIGHTFMPLVHEEDRASTKREFEKLFEPPHEAFMEQRALTKNGWRWLAWQDSAILDDKGEVVAIIGVGRDVTERKDAQRANRVSSDRLRIATKAARIGIFEYDFQHDKLIWDDEMFRLYGVDPDQFGGVYKDWQDAVHPDDLSAAERGFSNAIANHAVYETEFRVVRGDQTTRHLRALAEVEYEEDGNPIRAVGANWDVTPHRNLVAALTTSERDYRQLFENMTTGFALFEVLRNEDGTPRDYRFVKLNKAAEQIAERRSDQLVGRLLSEVFPTLEPCWKRGLERVTMTGVGVSIEDWLGELDKLLSTWMFVPRPGFVGVVVSDNTARRAAEEEVSRAREQLRHIVDNSIDVIFQLDVEGRYTFANSAIETLTGYSEEEILGMNVREVVHPDYHAATAERFRRREQGEQVSDSFTFQIVRKDGTTRWVELVSREVWDDANQFIGVQGVARDATFRVETERQIVESRQLLRTLIDTMPARVFWKDRESVYLGCNLAFARDSGLGDPDELVGKTDYEMEWAAAEADLYRADDLGVMTSGEPRINYEETQTDRDGRKRWLSTSKVPIRDADGEVIGVLGAYQDITERKALEEDRERLSIAINQSAEAVVIMDAAGRVIYVNPAYEAITGFSRDEVIDENLSEPREGAGDDELRERVRFATERLEMWEGRVSIRRADGERNVVEATVSPVKEADGSLINHVLTIRDVSRQVELEDHVRQAQKMDAVGRLAGGVAHDFNNILQSILGFSGMLISEMEEGSTQRADVEEIRKAARRAGDLTRQLLTLSRKRDVEYTVRDLNSIVRRNENMLRQLVDDSVTLECDLAEGLNPVRADMSQVEQILLNLVVNARDAMPKGGRLVIQTVGEGEDFVCLKVSDTGVGIRDDARDHLFEPFFTTKKVGEGTGLGLSVVYGIVQSHGGRIEVSSVVGEGAEFSVYLPARDRSEIEPLLDDAARFAESPEGHGEAVLVVEDDPVLRDLFRRVMNDAGYVVTAVSNQVKALDALRDQVFDLCLLDVVLPDGGGMEIAEEARALSEDARILLCSGYALDSDTHDAMKRNGYRYLEKPVGTMQLLQTTREMLDESPRV